MPLVEITTANPPPDPSLLPTSLTELGVKLDITRALSDHELRDIKAFQRAANYITAGPYIPILTSHEPI
jgi:hypothetical protein